MQAKQPLRDRRILVVEDDCFIMSEIRDVLAGAGASMSARPEA